MTTHTVTCHADRSTGKDVMTQEATRMKLLLFWNLTCQDCDVCSWIWSPGCCWSVSLFNLVYIYVLCSKCKALPMLSNPIREASDWSQIHSAVGDMKPESYWTDLILCTRAGRCGKKYYHDHSFHISRYRYILRYKSNHYFRFRWDQKKRSGSGITCTSFPTICGARYSASYRTLNSQNITTLPDSSDSPFQQCPRLVSLGLCPLGYLLR